MPGNCVDVLKDIQGWLCDLNMPNILWLSGSPGSTTIASTVVADFESFSGQFYFHRDWAESCDPDNLWRHLALDLALGKLISMALETQKAKIRGLDIPLQFEHLIIKLVQELFQDTATPLLIVIDALDECDQYQKLFTIIEVLVLAPVISSDSEEGIDAIDTLYHHMVSVAFQGLREAEKNSLSSVIGAIVIAKNSLCASDLEQLLGV